MATAALVSLLAIPLGLCACSANGDTVTNAADTLRAQLAAEMRPLVDSGGLVVNAVTESTTPLDIYSSALIADAQHELALPTLPATLARVSMSDVQSYASSSGTPPEWIDASLGILARESRIPFPRALMLAPSAPSATDVTSVATDLWLRAEVDHATANIADEPALLASARSLLGSNDLTVAAAWRATAACQVVEAKCIVPSTVSFSVPADLSDADKIFLVRAAAELHAQGVTITGWDSSQIRQLAEQSLTGIKIGDPVVATSLAVIIYRTGGGTNSFTQYLQRESSLRDKNTGLYRVYSQHLGTIQNTYDAYRITGDQFGTLIMNKPTYATLRSILAADPSLDPATKLQAIAMLHDQPHGKINSAMQAFVTSVSSSLAGRSFDSGGAAQALDEIDALRAIGDAPKNVSIEPVAVTLQNEAEVDLLIAQAGDDVLRNSRAVLAYYATYLRTLPKTVIAAGADDALLMSRLSVALIGPQQPSGEDVDALQRLVHSRIGCSQYPHLVRVAVTASKGCDLGETRLMLSSPIGLAAEGTP